MRLHILVEGESDVAFLQGWLPRLIPKHMFHLIPHRGKGRLSRDPTKQPDPSQQGLLDQLPTKLRVYGQILNPDTDRVLVLIDADDEDCQQLKQRLLEALQHCNPQPYVLFRIAVEETEAFYLGDWPAIKQAYPRAKRKQMEHYQQDSVCDTAELLQRVLGETSLDKVEWATRISPFMTTRYSGKKSNLSPSFRQLCLAILRLVGNDVSP